MTITASCLATVSLAVTTVMLATHNQWLAILSVPIGFAAVILAAIGVRDAR